MVEAVDARFLGCIKLPPDLDIWHIEQHFTLSDDELAAVKLQSSSVTRVGLALQIGYLKALGQPMGNVGRLQSEIVRYVAIQVGVPAPDIAGLRSLYRRRSTRYEHRARAIRIAGFHTISQGVRSALVGHLRKVSVSASGPDGLVSAARLWLRERRYLAPSRREVQSLASRVWRQHLELLDLDIRASTDVETWLSVLTRRAEGAGTTFEWLLVGPKSRTIAALEQELAKIDLLRRLGGAVVDLGDMPDAVVAAEARRIAAMKPSRIARLGAPGRTVALACFLRWQLRQRLDLTVELLSFLVSDLERRARDAARARMADAAPTLARRHALLVQDLVSLADSQGIAAAALRQALRDLIDRENAGPAPLPSKAGAVRIAIAGIGPDLVRLINSVTQLGLVMEDAHPLRVALDVLVPTPGEARITALPRGLSHPFGAAWSVLIEGEDRAQALGAWRAATLLLVRRSLRNGSVALPDSASYRETDKHLIPRKLWNRDQHRFLRDLGVNTRAGAYLKRLEPRMAEGLEALSAAHLQGMIGIEDRRLHIPRLKPVETDPEIVRTRSALLNYVGTVQLPDVIVDVDRSINLSGLLLGRAPRSDTERLQLYGAILSLGSDLDPARAARMMTGVSAEGIGQMVRRLGEGERIRVANAALVALTSGLDVAAHWGDGVHASSDMMSLDASRGLWSARMDPRRRTRAVGTYTHVLDKWALAYDQPIVLNERQAGVAIEGALRAEHAMIEQVAVDTHGVTHVSMALAKLVGFDICPRYAGLADRKLHVFRDTKVPEALEPIVSRTLSRRAVATGWEDVCRLAASTKGGWCSAIWAMRRMGSASSSDPVHRAAEHLGKLLRTIYLCDYLTNTAFRSGIETLLARGEAVHPLQRALHDGALAARRSRTQDQLKSVSAALTLLTNIVIAWNAMRFDDAMRDPTFSFPEDHFAHIAPTWFRHINLRGVFTFDLSRLQNSDDSSRNWNQKPG